MKLIIKTIIGLGIVAMYSCQAVKPYQSQFVNDNAMQQNSFAVEKAENEAINYREGASGGDGGKTGGGCGCN